VRFSGKIKLNQQKKNPLLKFWKLKISQVKKQASLSHKRLHIEEKENTSAL